MKDKYDGKFPINKIPKWIIRIKYYHLSMLSEEYQVPK